MAATMIFRSYSAFTKRADKKVNGVSPAFAKLNPDYEHDNYTNRGCWNCKGCEYCVNCVQCTRSTNLFKMSKCTAMYKVVD